MLWGVVFAFWQQLSWWHQMQHRQVTQGNSLCRQHGWNSQLTVDCLWCRSAPSQWRVHNYNIGLCHLKAGQRVIVWVSMSCFIETHNTAFPIFQLCPSQSFKLFHFIYQWSHISYDNQGKKWFKIVLHFHPAIHTRLVSFRYKNN